MKHVHFLVAGATMILSMPITFVGATPILGTVRCSDIEARLETPLDTHTEARFKKYLDGFSTPKTLASEEEAKRWCYLFELRESIEATNRVHRQDFRTRTLLQRFDNINVDTTGEKTTPPAAPLTDVELSDLPPSRQAKILRKLRLRNCTEGGGTTEEIEEYAICIKELAKAIESSDDAVLRRRVERLSERVSQPSTPSESSRSQETGDYTRGTAAQDLQSIHQAVVDVRTFDLHGPGSQPLSVPIEAKIKPYAERHDCSRVSIGESKIRCEWLVQYSYYLRKLNPSRSEANLRSLGLLNGVLLRRGVNQTYRSAVESTQGILNTRRLQGFRPSPRTIQDLKENFQSPVVVPGDCQVDPKLCNK